MRKLAVTLGFALLFLLPGCSWVSVDTQPYFDAPTYAPVDPGSVEILGSYPQSPYVTLGEVHLDATGNAPLSEIRMKLQKTAAKMGANAVVLLGDTSMMTVGALEPSSHWWSQLTDPAPDRLIVGTVIRYVR